ncbi:MAG: hypothetical protein P9L94_10585 [Candidatus Hinthialibacter antarcticus]|nr:hypothetical protein [Candidatus Hinthialibacter antarcticus]
MYSFQTIHIAALAFLLLCAALVTTPSASHADEDIDVNQRIETLETENAQLKSLIESMQKRLDALDGGGEAEEKKKDSDKKKKKKDDADKDASENTDNEPKADDKKKDKSEDDGIRKKDAPWLQSINNEYFRLGGRLRFGYFDVENETDLPSGIPENPGGSFTLNDFRLKLDADFTNDISFSSKFDTSHSKGENALVEAYVDFSDLVLSSELRAGLQPAFWRPDRFTKYYPINGRAFWAKRDLGVTWKGDWDPVNVYAGVSNGFPLDNTSLGEDDSNEIIGTDVDELDFDSSRELSVGVGYKLDFDDYGKLDILGFGVFGNLDEDDLDFLRVQVPGYGISQRDSRRWWGVNLEYDIADWDFFAQAIGARDGELERFAWYAEGSYKFDIDDIKYLQAVRPLVRYSSLDTNLTARPYSFGGSFTWDREQWMFAVISELTDNVSFRTEYALNLEETGGPDSSNNEILLLLTVEF